MARIIYVEDNMVAGELVCDVLRQAGHLVGVINHGMLAFKTIVFKGPDLVILDRSVPGLQGMEILKRLRQMPSTYLTPILMLTAKGGEAAVDEALSAGADDYLVKPFTPDDLVQRVATALEMKSFAANRKIR